VGVVLISNTFLIAAFEKKQISADNFFLFNASGDASKFQVAEHRDAAWNLTYKDASSTKEWVLCSNRRG